MPINVSKIHFGLMIMFLFVLCILGDGQGAGMNNPFIFGPSVAGSGNTGVALPDPGFIINNNPASLRQVSRYNVEAMYYGLNGGFKCLGLEADKRLNKSLVLGAGLDYMGEFDSSAYQFGISVARAGASFNLPLSKIDLAIGGGLFINTLSLSEPSAGISFSQNWVNFSVGSLAVIKDFLFARNNLFAGVKYSDISGETGAGLSYLISEPGVVLAYSYKTSGDGVNAFGVEKSFYNRFSIRVGLEDSFFHCGLGLIQEGLRFNYAYAANMLGVTHIFSLGLRM